MLVNLFDRLISAIFGAGDKQGSKSKFDVQKMVAFCEKEISNFAKNHPDEQIYAFAIDASLLCINTIEAFEKTLVEYQRDGGSTYEDPAEILDLRNNTGDWDYLGFAELDQENGFDFEEYNEHYHLHMFADDDEKIEPTDYQKSVAKLIEELKARKAFDCLNKTSDFSVVQVEHNY